MLRTRASPGAYQPHPLPPWIGTFCTPSPAQYCILVVAGVGGEQIPRQQYRLRGIYTRDTDSMTCGKLSGTWSQSGWDPSAVMGRDFGALGAVTFCMWSVWQPASKAPAYTFQAWFCDQQHETRVKVCNFQRQSQKTVLSRVPSLWEACYSPDQQLYWDSMKGQHLHELLLRFPVRRRCENSLEVVCYAAITNYSRAEGGERRLEM